MRVVICQAGLAFRSAAGDEINDEFFIGKPDGDASEVVLVGHTKILSTSKIRDEKKLPAREFRGYKRRQTEQPANKIRGYKRK